MSQIRIVTTRAPGLIPSLVHEIDRASHPVVLIPESFTLACETEIVNRTRDAGIFDLKIFSPSSAQVGVAVTTPSFQTWSSVFAMVSVRVAPQLVQVKVFVPSAVQVGAAVTVPLSQLCPVAGIVRFSRL